MDRTATARSSLHGRGERVEFATLLGLAFDVEAPLPLKESEAEA
jgi:hypothetical protein